MKKNWIHFSFIILSTASLAGFLYVIQYLVSIFEIYTFSQLTIKGYVFDILIHFPILGMSTLAFIFLAKKQYDLQRVHIHYIIFILIVLYLNYSFYTEETLHFGIMYMFYAGPILSILFILVLIKYFQPSKIMAS